MKRINKKSINYSFKVLAVFAFGLIFVPVNTTLAAYGANIGNYFASYQEATNPVPGVSSISPSFGDRGSGAKTVTITGNNFVPGSVGRVNGSNRTTTFIDHSHLLVQLTANDMHRSDNFFITVYNGEPGGGYSESALFTLKNITAVNSNTNETNYNDNSYSTSTRNNNNTYSSSSSSNTANSTNTSEDSNSSSLAASVILGDADSFLPSGLAQWVLLAIIILVIVILVRRVFGGRENFHNSPLKHA